MDQSGRRHDDTQEEATMSGGGQLKNWERRFGKEGARDLRRRLPKLAQDAKAITKAKEDLAKARQRLTDKRQKLTDDRAEFEKAKDHWLAAQKK
jgi:hypothetical protein